MIDQFTFRLKPKQDLKSEIEKFVINNKIKAGIIGLMVGSLNKAVLRMADGKSTKDWDEPLEIVSGTGTISENGCHIHISFSDLGGKVSGGHLKEGCVINTTAEIVILVFSDVVFQRVLDKETGYNELCV